MPATVQHPAPQLVEVELEPAEEEQEREPDDRERLHRLVDARPSRAPAARRRCRARSRPRPRGSAAGARSPSASGATNATPITTARLVNDDRTCSHRPRIPFRRGSPRRYGLRVTVTAMMGRGLQPTTRRARRTRSARGDEHAFEWLLDRYDATAAPDRAELRRHRRPSPTRSCRTPGSACIRGIDGFEQRSSLKTWLYRILMNIARTRGVRESPHHPVLLGVGALDDGDEPTFDPERFRPPDDPELARALGVVPARLGAPARERASSATETVGAASTRRSTQLPPAQREVLTLRDVDGWTSTEVCNALGLTETNQRVLLHRARAKVRRRSSSTSKARSPHDPARSTTSRATSSWSSSPSTSRRAAASRRAPARGAPRDLPGLRERARAVPDRDPHERTGCRSRTSTRSRRRRGEPVMAAFRDWAATRD